MDLHLIQTGSLAFLGFLALAAVGGKLLGAGLGARWAGFHWREAAQVGSGMVPRGEVTLIIASVCTTLGLIDTGIFSAIIGAVILSTLITPVLLKFTFSLASHRNPDSSEN